MKNIMKNTIKLKHINLSGELIVIGTAANIEFFLLKACSGKLSNDRKKIIVKPHHIKGTHAGYISGKVSFTFNDRSESLVDWQHISLPYRQKADIKAVDLQKLSNKYNIDFSICADKPGTPFTRYIEVVGGKINKNYCKYCGY